jgi:hypothetical protein
MQSMPNRSEFLCAGLDDERKRIRRGSSGKTDQSSSEYAKLTKTTCSCITYKCVKLLISPRERTNFRTIKETRQDPGGQLLVSRHVTAYMD